MTQIATYKYQYQKMDLPGHMDALRPNWANRSDWTCCMWTGVAGGAILRCDTRRRRHQSWLRPTMCTWTARPLAEPWLTISGNCSCVTWLGHHMDYKLHKMLHRHKYHSFNGLLLLGIFDYLLFTIVLPHFHLRGSIGVDKLKCGRTATSLHNHVIIRTFVS